MPLARDIYSSHLSYVIGDVLTEVYGYARARRCIWAGFVAMLFMALMATDRRSHAAGRELDRAGRPMSRCSARCPRIVFASIIAFWAGEFVNSYVMARMKVWTQGKHLWSRTIGSTDLWPRVSIA